jgi:hypothetical protein
LSVSSFVNFTGTPHVLLKNRLPYAKEKHQLGMVAHAWLLRRWSQENREFEVSQDKR